MKHTGSTVVTIALLVLALAFSGCSQETSTPAQLSQTTASSPSAAESLGSQDPFSSTSGEALADEPVESVLAKPSIMYLGQASVRIVTPEGKVVYVDPYAGEAADAARMVGAAHDIPYHNSTTNSGEMFDRDAAEAFGAPNAMVVVPGEPIYL